MPTKLLIISKASATVPDRSVWPVKIEITQPVPETDLKTMEAFYEMEALALASILIDTLPGGTLSRLTVHLLHHYAGLLKVSSKG